MFTGLIQDIGTLQTIRTGSMTALTIRGFSGEEMDLGESVAVNGICLSVVASSLGQFTVEATPHTCAVTAIRQWKVGRQLHLERALRMGDRLGGHIVQGHVDGISTLLNRRFEGGSLVLRFSLPNDVKHLFVSKGSVSIDGVSLTLSDLSDQFFQVTLIPDTQHRTTLGQLAVGDEVNVEADVLGKYVAALLKKSGNTTGVTEELLARSGFI